ncbi:hypothetical protein Mapa_017801 [Marchantia paleacea]|nr:hypothetical protein Mapa_017801 [Marchantia paleacea]
MGKASPCPGLKASFEPRPATRPSPLLSSPLLLPGLAWPLLVDDDYVHSKEGQGTDRQSSTPANEQESNRVSLVSSRLLAFAWPAPRSPLRPPLSSPFINKIPPPSLKFLPPSTSTSD